MNYLALEPLLVARLEARLAALDPRPHVLTAPDLAGVTEQQQLSPAVHVVYLGSRIVQEQGGGQIATIEQDWITVVAVRNVRDIRKGDAARAEAGLLMSAVFEALAGWRPDGFPALRPSTPPRSGYTDGFAYHPLGWTTRMQMRGQS